MCNNIPLHSVAMFSENNVSTWSKLCPFPLLNCYTVYQDIAIGIYISNIESRRRIQRALCVCFGFGLEDQMNSTMLYNCQINSISSMACIILGSNRTNSTLKKI